LLKNIIPPAETTGVRWCNEEYFARAVIEIIGFDSGIRVATQAKHRLTDRQLVNKKVGLIITAACLVHAGETTK
jgi:hypothetical protein